MNIIKKIMTAFFLPVIVASIAGIIVVHYGRIWLKRDIPHSISPSNIAINYPNFVMSRSNEQTSRISRLDKNKISLKKNEELYDEAKLLPESILKDAKKNNSAPIEKADLETIDEYLFGKKEKR